MAKPTVVGNARGGHPLRIGCPGFGQVELVVDQVAAVGGGPGGEDGHGRVLDAACGAGVLPLDADGVLAFLQVAGLVEYEHPFGLGGDLLPGRGGRGIADGVLVPDRVVEEVLEPPRVGVSGVLRDRPAVLAGQVSLKPGDGVGGQAPGLDPGEPARARAQQLGGHLTDYAHGSGCRCRLFLCHNLKS